MNQPATFVHWSIFDVTVANLVLIGVMVVIFGAALLLPFPKGERVDAAAVTDSAANADVAGAVEGALFQQLLFVGAALSATILVCSLEAWSAREIPMRSDDERQHRN